MRRQTLQQNVPQHTRKAHAFAPVRRTKKRKLRGCSRHQRGRVAGARTRLRGVKQHYFTPGDAHCARQTASARSAPEVRARAGAHKYQTPRRCATARPLRLSRHTPPACPANRWPCARCAAAATLATRCRTGTPTCPALARRSCSARNAKRRRGFAASTCVVLPHVGRCKRAARKHAAKHHRRAVVCERREGAHARRRLRAKPRRVRRWRKPG